MKIWSLLNLILIISSGENEFERDTYTKYSDQGWTPSINEVKYTTRFIWPKQICFQKSILSYTCPNIYVLTRERADLTPGQNQKFWPNINLIGKCMYIQNLGIFIFKTFSKIPEVSILVRKISFYSRNHMLLFFPNMIEIRQNRFKTKFLKR